MRFRSLSALCCALVAAPMLTFAPAPSNAATSVETSLPFFGVNVSKELTRSIERPGHDVGYEWSAAEQLMTDVLGVDTVRSGIYCASASVDSGHENFSPFDCASDKIDEARLLERVIENDGLSVAPVIQIEWREAEKWPGHPGQTEAARDDYYQDFGKDIGRALGSQVAAGKVPYFELGNEPDHACIVEGNPWGTSIDHFNAACVARAASSILALQVGIRAGVAEVAPDAVPRFAVGSSGVRWGMTDALQQQGVAWDFTAVHLYYQSGYGATAGPSTDQSLGFNNVPVFADTQAQFLNAAKVNRDSYKKPIVVTEFGVFPRQGVQHGAGLPENRANSFQRVLTGLVTNAAEYNIAGVFAFTLQGPEGGSAEEGGTGGEFNLIDHSADQYQLTELGERYRDLIADPETMALTVTAPGSGAYVRPADTFTGTGLPGTHVQVLDDALGRSLCETEVAADTSWSCVPTIEMKPGIHTGQVAQTNNDRTSQAPLAYTVTASMTAPAQDGIGPAGTTPFSGTGRPGASISIDGYSGTHLCDTTVSTEATWSCTSLVSLAPGPYKVLLRQDEEPPTQARFTLRNAAPITSTTPSATPSTTPLFTGRGDRGAAIAITGTSGRVLATTTVQPDGTWSATSTIALPIDPYTVTASQVADTGVRTTIPITFSIIRQLVVTAPTATPPVNTPTPTFAGTGHIGASIEIRGRSGRLLASTTVGSNAKWSAVSTASLPKDTYTVDATQKFDDSTTKVDVTFTIAP